MRFFRRLLRYALIFGVVCIVLAGIGIGVVYWLVVPRLPSVESLRDVSLQVPLRIYSADNKLIATYGETRRIPIKIEQVPAQVKNAFLAAEDANFYNHSGIDWQGTMRAIGLVISRRSLHVPGGSTITQQVARDFFLSSDVNLSRKATEILLSFKIENTLTKDQIFELYLNKIFLGNRAYGVAAAAEFYYGKTLDQLDLAECGMLASLPKFPSTGNPLNNRARALERRRYVLQRMLENGFIDEAQLKQADAEPERAFAHEPPIEIEAPWVAELVRQEAIQRLGNNALTDAYTIRTTIDSREQTAANEAVRAGLIAYDHRHGWRGPEAHVELSSDASDADLDKKLDVFHTTFGLVPAIVTQSSEKEARLHLNDGRAVVLGLDDIAWARRYQDETSRGPTPKRVDAALKPGDIVRVAQYTDPKKAGRWQLAQIPAVQGAFVALDPEDGAVRAEVGGFSFARSKFNRAVQSARNPGSSFKPLFYAAAFEHGFTPASIVNDAPVVFPDPSKPNGQWTPKNDDDSFAGPMRLREAMAQSKNLVSVRLLDAIGVRYAREFVTRFGLTLEQVPPNLSMALGTASVSPMNMARAYAVIANGGYLVDPYFIDAIYDRDGKEVFKAQPAQVCAQCPGRAQDDGVRSAAAPATRTVVDNNGVTTVPLSPIDNAQAATETANKLAPRVLDARTAYLIGSLLRDVIRRGTGSGAMVLKRNDLFGKTGSTNDHRDGWFIGYNADLVAAAWMGFDDFSSMGHIEFGAQTALPIWIDFMRAALDGVPEKPFDMPPGISTAQIDPESGLLAAPGAERTISEVFRTEDLTRIANSPNQPTEAEKKVQQEAYGIF
ncbi:MAG: penicillin-binding protein 1A [Rudaea sp.]|uniref:penicillin-binding protein 1A n=1 Tax=Rudaea sp. TaxID=2136325 RepID=UPI0039E4B437